MESKITNVQSTASSADICYWKLLHNDSVLTRFALEGTRMTDTPTLRPLEEIETDHASHELAHSTEGPYWGARIGRLLADIPALIAAQKAADAMLRHCATNHHALEAVVKGYQTDAALAAHFHVRKIEEVQVALARVTAERDALRAGLVDIAEGNISKHSDPPSLDQGRHNFIDSMYSWCQRIAREVLADADRLLAGKD